ncbi:hypothetical protein VPH35_107258 [Triticum aestivum]
MSHAFGNYCVKDYGVISAPEVTQSRITARDQFVILATDGVMSLHKCSIPPQFELVRGCSESLHALATERIGRKALQDSIRKWTRGRLHPHRRMGDADIGQRQGVQSLRF